MIDEEVRRIVDTGMVTAERILTENRGELESLAQALLEYESLSGDEIGALLRGEPIVRPDPDEPPTDKKGRTSVPTSGPTKNTDEGEPDLEPQPQPGS